MACSRGRENVTIVAVVGTCCAGVYLWDCAILRLREWLYDSLVVRPCYPDLLYVD